MNSRQIDLTETNVNIDNLLDVYIETQKENGIDVGMHEVDISIDYDGHVKRDKFSHDKEKGKEKKDHKHSCHACDGNCQKKPDKGDIPWYMINNMGLFGDDASTELDIDDGEDDGKYICEYCTDIGYKKEYRSYICDTCRSCETCSEYEAGDCDGCTYSMYRTGRLYSAELASNGNTSFLEQDEQDIINSIEAGDYKEGVQEPDLSFTVMNYDHTFDKN